MDQAAAPGWRALSAGAAGNALAAFAAIHPDIDAAPALALACSGGADSTALLLAALLRWGPERLRVLHVDHGLQPAATDFAARVRALCAAWGVSCSVLAVRVTPRPRASIEELARDARYAALGQAARDAGCDWLLLGHQADDQAESLLLALLRGGGPRGLAAMPAVAARDGVRLARPLLEVTGAALRTLLSAQRVPWIDDPMNADPRLRRNRIRGELLPVIARLEPGWATTLARSARLCAQAAQGIETLAASDLAACEGPHGLHLPALRALPRARLAEALRLWLAHAGTRCNAAQIDELCRQLGATAQGAVRLRVGLAGVEVRRRGAWLELAPRAPL